jgi:transposase
MEKQQLLAPIAGLQVTGVKRDGGRWLISATGTGHGACPACGTLSTSRHSTYLRSLQDLPLQGMRVTIEWRAVRLRCRHHACAQRIFAERLPGVAERHARRTGRMADIVHLLGHGTGGRPAERILQRLGMPVSDDTVLRVVQRRATQQQTNPSPVRVVGIDDWAWQKGQRYGTIMVDLERRTVVDVLPDRSAASVAAWLRDHPQVEIISRDRHGLYAEGARQGAPQARQVADRFHLVQTLREKIEQQLARLGRPIGRQTSAAVEEEVTRAGLHGVRQEMFEQVRGLHQAGKTATPSPANSASVAAVSTNGSS